MRKIIVIVSAILTAAIPVAAEDSEFARPGMYLVAGVSMGFYTELGSDVDNPPGFNLRGGYRANPWVAAEVAYEFLSDADVEIEEMGSGEVGTDAFTANLKIFPLHGRFQPFLLAGVGVVMQRINLTQPTGRRETDAAVAGRFGGGFDVYVTENIALSLDGTYLLPFSELNRIDGNYTSIGFGVQYRF